MPPRKQPAVARDTHAEVQLGIGEDSGSLTNKAYRGIQRRIVHLELPPGRMFTEGELAAELGMSKTPVREALRVLQMQQFVRAAPRAGWVITPITLRDAQYLYEMRRLLEPEAADVAAQRGLCEAHVKQLKAWGKLDVDPRKRESLDAFLKAYGHFPTVVAMHTGNPRLVAAVHDVGISLERLFRLAVMMFEPQEKVAMQREELVSALIDNNGSRARSLVEQHIKDERRMVIDALLDSDAIQHANVGG